MATAATTRRRGTAGPDRVTIALFSLAGFLVVLALLGSQLGVVGHANADRPREVLVRRVYQTTVVERVPHSVAAGSSTGSSTVTQSVSGSHFDPSVAAAPGLHAYVISVEVDYMFHSMGSEIRLQLGRPLLPSAPSPQQAAEREHEYVLDFAYRLSRFEPESELTALNRDPRTEVPASELLRAAVGAGLWAAERTGGLVEPTLVGELERGGYVTSMDGVQPVSLREALAARRRAVPLARIRASAGDRCRSIRRRARSCDRPA